MLLKFLKFFFSILALMLFAFLVNITFYFSNYSKNNDFISSIIKKEDNSIYRISNKLDLKKVKFSSGETLSGIFLKNLNSIDKIYFSKANSYEVKYSSGNYELNLGKGQYFLDLNDLSVSYKIKGAGFEIEPKSAGMIFLDTNNPFKTKIVSLNSVFKFIFKSRTGRKVNYYYMYPHNYLIFNIKNNEFSRIGGDVFRIKTIVSDGFLKDKLIYKLNSITLFSENNLSFLEVIFKIVNKEFLNYKLKFKNLKNLEYFSLIGQKYIDKYFNFFVNETKKRVYYKQSILNNIQELFNEKTISAKVSKNIINKLEKLKQSNLSDYNDVIAILEGYYKIILKNNSLKDKVILDNFLPLIKYIKLVDLGKVKNLDDLVFKIKNNQNTIFNNQKINEIYSLSKQNLDYLYLLRNLDKDSFTKVVLNLELKYKQLIKKNISKSKNILLDKYYYGVLNLKQGNDDLELYILLKNIFFTYDFGNTDFDLEKYFNDFVNTYFSKLKIVNNEIIVGQHIDIVLLKSFLYYLEDYLNKFAFGANDNIKADNIKRNTKNLIYNISILEKYFFLNKYIYFNSGSIELIKTGIFKNKYLINNILNFVRKKLFKKEKQDGLLINSSYYNLSQDKLKNFSNIVYNFFKLERINKSKIESDSKFKVLLEDYNKLYKKYSEYFLALLNYEEYKTKYSKLDSQLDNYKIKIKENKLGKSDIIEFLSQFNGADFSNTKILKTQNLDEFEVKNFNVNGGVVSFKINPEKGYLIYNLIVENTFTEKDKKKFYNSMYSLEREESFWEKNKRYAKGEDKEKYNFNNYFKLKFFDSYITQDNIKYEDVDLRHGKKGESEGLRVFKRDKLLSKNGEFSSINDILRLNYNDVIVKDLRNIIIKNAVVIQKIGDISYIGKFNSKYYIDLKNNKHYFYDENGIKITFYINRSGKELVLLSGISIKVNFDINLYDFKKVFNNLFNNISLLDRIVSYVNNNLLVQNIDISYNKNGFIVVSFENNGKKFEFYVRNNKISFIKKSGIILKEKNINITDLPRLNLEN